MEQINQDSLLQYLGSIKVNGNCKNHVEFLEWHNETKELVIKLDKIGKIKIEPSADQYNLQYWGADAPVELDKYPYYECEIFKCKTCGTVFFYYLELGGHGPQRRYRVIRKELINIDKIKPERQIIIDYKDLDYAVYKNPDLTYEISISKSLGIGVDIYHQLTKDEQNLYIKFGIASLKERIKDMDINFNNYKVIPWR